MRHGNAQSSSLLAAGVAAMALTSACAPGKPVLFEELLHGEAIAGVASNQSNSCSALEVFLGTEMWIDEYFSFFLPEEEPPSLEFEDGAAVLSFTLGCVASGNELYVEDVFLKDDILHIHETIIQAEPTGEQGTFRPYNVTWLDLSDWEYPAEVTIDIEFPSMNHEEGAR